jgi:hypothetical protein
MIGSKLGTAGMATLMQEPNTAQTATPERGGVFTCPECTRFYTHANDQERRYHLALRMLVRNAWPNRAQWAEEFEKLTGESLTEYTVRNRRADQQTTRETR